MQIGILWNPDVNRHDVGVVFVKITARVDKVALRSLCLENFCQSTGALASGYSGMGIILRPRKSNNCFKRPYVCAEGDPNQQ